MGGVYKVGKHKGSYSGISVHQQEVQALLQHDHPYANNPRKAFDHDLSNFSVAQQNLGCEVVICMDANTPLNSAESRTFMATSNLFSIAEYKFPNRELPRTNLARSALTHA